MAPTYSTEEGEEREAELGSQAVPSAEPNWNPNVDEGEWSHRHVLQCIVEGLRCT
jgi:hypothetical protein